VIKPEEVRTITPGETNRNNLKATRELVHPPSWVNHLSPCQFPKRTPPPSTEDSHYDTKKNLESIMEVGNERQASRKQYKNKNIEPNLTNTEISVTAKSSR